MCSTLQSFAYMMEPVGEHILAACEALPSWLRLASTSRAVRRVVCHHSTSRKWRIRADTRSCTCASPRRRLPLCSGAVFRSCQQLPIGAHILAIVDGFAVPQCIPSSRHDRAQRTRFRSAVVWTDPAPQQPCVSARLSLPSCLPSFYSIGLMLSTSPDANRVGLFFLTGAAKFDELHFEVDMNIQNRRVVESRVTMRTIYCGRLPWQAAQTALGNTCYHYAHQ